MREADAAWEQIGGHLAWSTGFWFGMVYTPSPEIATDLLRRTQERTRVRVLRPATPEELRGLLPLVLEDTEAGCVWVEALGVGPWVDAWVYLAQRANERRELVRSVIKGGLVFAAHPTVKTALRDNAPDLWSIRSFLVEVDGRPAVAPDLELARDEVQRLTRDRPGDVDGRVRVLVRLVDAHLGRGELDEASARAEEAVVLGGSALARSEATQARDRVRRALGDIRAKNVAEVAVVEPYDFFISYTLADRDWAEWIAWVLEQDGHRCVIEAWDSKAGADWVAWMDDATRRARQTLLVLTPAYLESHYGGLEWRAAIAQKRPLLPVRVREVALDGVRATSAWVDLIGLDERAAQERLVRAARGERMKPERPPHFPGRKAPDPAFPGRAADAYTILQIAGVRGDWAKLDAIVDDIVACGVRADRVVFAGNLLAEGKVKEVEGALAALRRMTEALGLTGDAVLIAAGEGEVNTAAVRRAKEKAEEEGRESQPPWPEKWEAWDKLRQGLGVSDVRGEARLQVDEGVVTIVVVNTTWGERELGARQLSDAMEVIRRTPDATFVVAAAPVEIPGAAVVLHAGEATVNGVPGLREGWRSYRFEVSQNAEERRGAVRWRSREPGAGGWTDGPAAGWSWVGGRPERPRPAAIDDPRDPVLDHVEDVLTARYPGVALERRGGEVPWIKAVICQQGVVETLAVGVLAEVGAAQIETFRRSVLDPLTSVAPNTRGELVSRADRPTEQAGDLRVLSMASFEGLLDLRAYADKLRRRLEHDVLYPRPLFVDQRLRACEDPARGFDGAIVQNALAHVLEWLREPSRLVLLLGDFGVGKTFLLRQLAWELLAREEALTPLFVNLRLLDKSLPLDSLLAAALAPDLPEFSATRLRWMIEQGKVVLLFDGFDELAVRVGYDQAAAHLGTLLDACRGRARVLIASRHQHFLRDGDVRTKAMEDAARVPGFRVGVLQDFDTLQVRTFLERWFQIAAEGRPAVSVVAAAEEAGRWEALLGEVRDLMGLSRNPRLLSFIASLDRVELEKRAAGTAISAAALYKILVDRWLRYEQARTDQPGATRALPPERVLVALTELARRLWTSTAASAYKDELGAALGAVVAGLTAIEGEGVAVDAANVHQLGSASLLVRDGDGTFRFVHQSVQEWLVARHAAAQVREGKAPADLERADMSALMADFFVDMAGVEAAGDWGESAAAESTGVRNRVKVLGVKVDGRPLLAHRRLDLSGKDLSGEDLRGRSLMGANLSGAKLVGAILEGMDLRGADLTGANLRDARLEDANLSDAKLIGVNGVGLRALNAYFDRADLGGCDLSGALLNRASFIGARLRSARLMGAQLEGSVLREADLYGADLSDARMAGADLSGADLTGTVLRRAWLANAQFTGTALAGADAHRAVLLGAKGLQTPVVVPTLRPVLPVAMGEVYALAWAPHRDLLAIGCDVGVVVVDPRTRRMLWQAGHGADVKALVFTPDGRQLISGDYEGDIRVFDADCGVLLEWVAAHGHGVQGLAVHGDTLVSVALNAELLVWSLASRTVVRRVNLEMERALAMALSPDGATIAVTGWAHGTGLSSQGAGVVLLVSGAGIRSADLPAGGRSLSWSGDGSTLACAVVGGGVELMEVATLTCRAVARTDVGDVVAWRPGRDQIATLGPSETEFGVWVLRTDTGAPVVSFFGGGRCYALQFSPDGEMLAIGSTRPSLWSSPSGAVFELAVSTARVLGVTQRGTALSVLGGGLLTVREAASLRKTWSTVALVRHCVESNGVTACGYGRELIVYDQGVPRSPSVSLNGSIYGVALSPDARIALVSEAPEMLTVLDLTTGVLIRRVHASDEGPVLTFAPDGATAVVGDARDVALYSVPALSCIRRVTAVEPGPLRPPFVIGRRVRSVTFSPNGVILASGGDDAYVRLWHPTTLAPLATLEGHTGSVRSLAFSSDSQLLASGSRDGSIRVWDVTTHTCVTVLTGHLGTVTTLCWRGSMLLSGGADGHVRIWHPSLGRWLAAFLPADEGTLLITADGRYRAIDADENQILYPIGPASLTPSELQPFVKQRLRLEPDEPWLPEDLWPEWLAPTEPEDLAAAPPFTDPSEVPDAPSPARPWWKRLFD